MSNRFFSSIHSASKGPLLGFIKEYERGDDPDWLTGKDIGDGEITVGYGTIRKVYGGDTITEEEAEQYLIEDVVASERDVVRLVKTELKAYEFDALVSLVYNVGAGALGRSKALKALNKGDRIRFKLEAFDVRKGFVRVNKKIWKGLVARRRDELNIFEGKGYERTYE